MSRPSDRQCKDCAAELERRDAKAPKTPRPAPYAGPRCATHHRQAKRAAKAKAHEKYVEKTYSLPPGEYEKLYVFQGQVCAICQRATGATRRLSVDHDHACCAGPVSCGKCVRGLICRPCNDLLGHVRDSEQTLSRAIHYLRFSPARRMRLAVDLRG